MKIVPIHKLKKTLFIDGLVDTRHCTVYWRYNGKQNKFCPCSLRACSLVGKTDDKSVKYDSKSGKVLGDTNIISII